MKSRRVFAFFIVLLLLFWNIRIVFCSEIVNDGFESNDFSAWDGTGGSPAVESNNPHCGTYNMIINAINEYCYETDTEAYSQINTRIYIKVSSLADNGDGVMFIGCQVANPVWDAVAGAMIRNSGGTYEWGIWVHGTGRVWSGDTFNTGTWYCAELEYIKGDGDAEVRLYVDTIDVESATGETIDYSINTVRIGSGWAADAPTYYIDCCIVADGYVGPEASDTYPTYSNAGDDGETGVG